MVDKAFPGPVLITACSFGVGHAAALAFRGVGFAAFTSVRDPAPLDALRTGGHPAARCHGRGSGLAGVETIEAKFGALGVLSAERVARTPSDTRDRCSCTKGAVYLISSQNSPATQKKPRVKIAVRMYGSAAQ